MKYIKLETHKIIATSCPCCKEYRSDGQVREFVIDYREMFLQHVTNIPEGTTSLEFIETALAVRKKLQAVASGQWLALETAEMNHLKGVLGNIRLYLADETLLAWRQSCEKALDKLPDEVLATMTGDKLNGEITDQPGSLVS